MLRLETGACIDRAAQTTNIPGYPLDIRTAETIWQQFHDPHHSQHLTTVSNQQPTANHNFTWQLVPAQTLPKMTAAGQTAAGQRVKEAADLPMQSTVRWTVLMYKSFLDPGT